MTPALDNSYTAIIAQIKIEIETARLRAAISVNQHLLVLYWKIGCIILEQQSAEGWGTKVIDRLSDDLRREFPDMKGTSARNLKYMRAFAEAYPEFLQQLVAEFGDDINVQHSAAQIPNNAIVQPSVAQLQNDPIVQDPLAQFEIAAIVQDPLAQFEIAAIVQDPLARLTWYHHITLLDKIKDIGERLFYIKKLPKMAGAEMY